MNEWTERLNLSSVGEYNGVIGETVAESTASFPETPAAPQDAPNIVVVLLDDVGFGQPSTFGGPVDMPTLDAIAARGLKYNRFHTTAMCSPTRAALLSGRNHHQVAAGCISEIATGFPGYSSYWPSDAATMAEVLRLNGYSTAALGKWHNTPEWETGPNGPFDRWPTGLGFEHYYGFMGADCNQWQPTLYRNTTLVDPPGTPEEGYHLDKDLADEAIGWVRKQRSVSPERPFLLYWAPGTAHTPHHAPRDWIERFQGRFDNGWDALREETLERQIRLGVVPEGTTLTERPDELPSWDSLTDDQRRLYARYMESFSAALSHFDHQFGRFVTALEDLGEFDNTLIVFIAGDNGPAAEGTPQGQFNKWANVNGLPEEHEEILAKIDEIGSPSSYPNYPVGWAWAGATPFQWFKQIASHLGGIRNGMVMSWPDRLGSAEIRPHFSHVVDVMPTILDAAGVPVPEVVNGVAQSELSGRSLLPSAEGTEEPNEVPRTQYFEILGNRGIYDDEWMAGARHGRLPWQYTAGSTGVFDEDQWELYNPGEDFSQANDLATSRADQPERLKEKWHSEAEHNNVFPLDDRFGGARMSIDGKPNPAAKRRDFTFYGPQMGLPESLAPNVKGRSHSITVEVDHRVGDSGILVSAGGRFAGYSLFIQNDVLMYVHNIAGRDRIEVASTTLPPGALTLAMEFTTDTPTLGSGGTLVLTCNGVEVGGGHIRQTIPYRYSYGETFNIGRDNGSSVSTRYSGPFEYTGDIKKTQVKVLSELGEAAQQEEAEQAVAIERDTH